VIPNAQWILTGAGLLVLLIGIINQFQLRQLTTIVIKSQVAHGRIAEATERLTNDMDRVHKRQVDTDAKMNESIVGGHRSEQAMFNTIVLTLENAEKRRITDMGRFEAERLSMLLLYNDLKRRLDPPTQ
jgi:hypothetical protein